MYLNWRGVVSALPGYFTLSSKNIKSITVIMQFTISQVYARDTKLFI